MANTNAQGQNTTMTVTPRTMSPVTSHASMAMVSAMGTSQLAQRSAMRWVGAWWFSASSTMRISF